MTKSRLSKCEKILSKKIEPKSFNDVAGAVKLGLLKFNCPIICTCENKSIAIDIIESTDSIRKKLISSFGLEHITDITITIDKSNITKVIKATNNLEISNVESFGIGGV